jgi:hypothetical protein
MGFVKHGRKQGCIFLMRTVKKRKILKVKNALQMPVQYVTELPPAVLLHYWTV